MAIFYLCATLRRAKKYDTQNYNKTLQGFATTLQLMDGDSGNINILETVNGHRINRSSRIKLIID
jgi:hypothetical protein